MTRNANDLTSANVLFCINPSGNNHTHARAGKDSPPDLFLIWCVCPVSFQGNNTSERGCRETGSDRRISRRLRSPRCRPSVCQRHGNENVTFPRRTPCQTCTPSKLTAINNCSWHWNYSSSFSVGVKNSRQQWRAGVAAQQRDRLAFVSALPTILNSFTGVLTVYFYTIYNFNC